MATCSYFVSFILLGHVYQERFTIARKISVCFWGTCFITRFPSILRSFRIARFSATKFSALQNPSFVNGVTKKIDLLSSLAPQVRLGAVTGKGLLYWVCLLTGPAFETLDVRRWFDTWSCVTVMHEHPCLSPNIHLSKTFLWSVNDPHHL